MGSTCSPKKLCYASILTILVTLVLRWGVIDPMVHVQIDNMLTLEPGTEIWDFWTNIPIPIYIKFYFFNVTNPDGIARGEKPILQEIGPYVYEEKRSKIILKANEDVIKYRPKTLYFFRRDLSFGSDEDLVSMINVPFVAVARMAWDMTKEPVVLNTLDGMMREKKEPLFHVHKVKDFLFDGVSIENFMELLTLPVGDLIGESDVKIPKAMLDGNFALFDDKNGTADDVWEVHTGRKDKKQFAQVISWNNKSRQNVWKNEKCDRIEGSDGTLFPPFSTKDSVLTGFSPDVCRTVGMTFKSHGQFMGMNTLKFGYPPEFFGSLDKYPQNACYCKTSNKFCEMGGVASIAPCIGGAPVYVSQPHFTGAHPNFIAGVDGLTPGDYETVLDIEPLIGLPIRGSMKLQFNIHVEPYDSMDTFASLPDVLLPILWAEESATVTPEFAKPIKLLINGLALMDFLAGATLLFGSVTAIAAFIWYATQKKWKFSADNNNSNGRH